MALKEDVAIVADVTTKVNQSLNLEETLETALSEVMKVFKTKVGGIYLWDEGLQKLVLRTNKNFTESFIKKLSYVNAGQGCAGTVKNTGKIFAELNPVKHHYICADAEKMMGLDCLVAAPISSKGNVVGVLELFAPLYRNLTGREIKMIGILCDILGTAIENSKIHGDLKDLADTLQKTFLPKKPPVFKQATIQSVYKSATKEAGVIGGDFYDFIKFSESKVGIIIGDAAGKGVEATSLAALAKGAIEIYAEQNIEPCQVLELANRYVTKKTEPSQFITAQYLLIDFYKNKIIISNAGHLPPIIIRDNANKIDVIKTGSIPLGIETHQHYEDIVIKIENMNSLLLYTDGTTEARRSKDFLREKGFIKFVKNNFKKNPENYVQNVLNDILNYSNNVLDDDIAMVGINFK